MPLGGALVRATGALLAMCVVVAALGAFALKGEVDAFVTTPASSEAKNFVLKIPRGAGPQVVSRLLAKHGVVSDAEKFAYFLRYEKAAPKLRAGEFLFSTGATPPEVLEVLVSGREHTYPVTFPEGLRIEEMAARAEEAGLGPADRALCEYAEKLTETPGAMAEADISMLRQHGFDDTAIHDAIQIIGYFNYINRIADSLGVELETFVLPWEQDPR